MCMRFGRRLKPFGERPERSGLSFGSSRPAGAMRICHGITLSENPEGKTRSNRKKAPSQNRATLFFACAGGISPPWMYGTRRGRGIRPHQSPPLASGQLFAVPCKTHPNQFHSKALHTFSVVIEARLAPPLSFLGVGNSFFSNTLSTCALGGVLRLFPSPDVYIIL